MIAQVCGDPHSHLEEAASSDHADFTPATADVNAVPADSARCRAATVESDPSDRAGQIYNLLGAAEMNHAELASAVGDALGRKITYENESFEAFEARLAQAGMTPYFIPHIMNVYRDYNAGVFTGTNDVVQRLTGRTPVTVGEYVKANFSRFQSG